MGLKNDIPRIDETDFSMFDKCQPLCRMIATTIVIQTDVEANDLE